MNRRQFFGGALMAGASSAVAEGGRHAAALPGCACAPVAASALEI